MRIAYFLAPSAGSVPKPDGIVDATSETWRGVDTDEVIALVKLKGSRFLAGFRPATREEAGE